MNFKKTTLAMLLIGVLQTSHADYSRIAIQGAIVNGGAVSIGLAKYAPCYELGITGGAVFASGNSISFTPTIFGGFRRNWGENTFFAYGLDVSTTIGRYYGESFGRNVFIAPYISLEQMVSSHIMVSGFINPYAFQYRRYDTDVGYIERTTNHIFSTGGLALSYLF